MSKFAWIENGIVRDVCHGDPTECYHPDIAAFYTEQVPDDAAHGDAWNGATLTKYIAPTPPVIEPVTPVAPVVTVPRLWLLFTSLERVAIRATRATDAQIDDFMLILEDPKTVEVDLSIPSIQSAITLCISKTSGNAQAKAARVASILAGVIA